MSIGKKLSPECCFQLKKVLVDILSKNVISSSFVQESLKEMDRKISSNKSLESTNEV